jgi:hypothetical protein
MKPVTSRLSGGPCPYCGELLDAATGDPRGPLPGDFTICFHCSELLKFDAELRPAKLSARELIEAQGSAMWPRIRFVQQTIRRFHECESAKTKMTKGEAS